MAGRAEQLFNQLTNCSAILALIGQCEDAHLDCKEWPKKDDDAQRVLAKAACGFANADGGVLVVGMKARATSKDEPDVIDSAAPVEDTVAVKSRILDLVGQLVEPGVERVQAAEINEPPGSRSGFVVVHIPASDELPRRSRKDWKFYLRIGSGTFPMEYFQIADMFGRRPQPKLDLYLQPTGQVKAIPYDNVLHRYFWLGLSNMGRGIAKFPGIRFRRADCSLTVSNYGLDGNGANGLPLRPADQEWVVFRGGADDVIYPGTTLKVTQLIQRATRADPPKSIAIFDSTGFSGEISCEGASILSVEQVIPEYRQE
jgi:hypothetical protein